MSHEHSCLFWVRNITVAFSLLGCEFVSKHEGMKTVLACGACASQQLTWTSIPWLPTAVLSSTQHPGLWVTLPHDTLGKVFPHPVTLFCQQHLFKM